MALPAVTREYTPGSRRNSRNPMRHSSRWKMRPASAALGAEQFRVANQTRKDPQCAWWNTRESPIPLSQEETNTAITSGVQNCSVYPKSYWDEAHFPFIGSIALPCSTSCRRSGFTSFRKLQRFPETPVSSLYEYQFQYSNTRKAPCTPYRPKMRTDSLSLTEEVSQISTSTSRGVFPQQQGFETDPVFSVSSGMDLERPWLKRRPNFPAVT